MKLQNTEGSVRGACQELHINVQIDGVGTCKTNVSRCKRLKFCSQGLEGNPKTNN